MKSSGEVGLKIGCAREYYRYSDVSAEALRLGLRARQADFTRLNSRELHEELGGRPLRF